MTHTITLIPGDGIGPEVTAAVVSIIEASGVEGDMGAARRGGARARETRLAAARRSHRLGPPQQSGAEGTRHDAGRRRLYQRQRRLRKALDLYANLRPVANLPHVRSRFENVDLVIVRENTEDLYAGLEHEVVPGVVESLKIITERASTRIAHFAFDYA